MDLTQSFNEAANGPQGDPTAVESGGPHDFGGGGGAAEAYVSEQEPAAEVSDYTPRAAASQTFEEAAAPEVEQTAPERDIEQAPEPPLSLDEAEAELTRLEAQRSTHELQHNLRPPRDWEKAAHQGLARTDANRIFALKAYLEFSREEPEPEHAQDHEQGDNLEFDY